MGKTNKDNKYKSYRSDRAKEFNRDEKRKQKHERDALRSGDIERLVNVEDETGNTFFSTEPPETEHRHLWPKGCRSEEEFRRELDDDEFRYEYEKWLTDQKD